MKKRRRRTTSFTVNLTDADTSPERPQQRGRSKKRRGGRENNHERRRSSPDFTIPSPMTDSAFVYIGRNYLRRTVEARHNLTGARKAFTSAYAAVAAVDAAQDEMHMLQHNLLRLIRAHNYEITVEDPDPESDAEMHLNRTKREGYRFTPHKRDGTDDNSALDAAAV